MSKTSKNTLYKDYHKDYSDGSSEALAYSEAGLRAVLSNKPIEYYTNNMSEQDLKDFRKQLKRE